MSSKRRFAILCLLLASTTSCAATARSRATAFQEAEKRGNRGEIEAFSTDLEFAEMNFARDVGPESTIFDVERERKGVRAAFGIDAVRGFVQLFEEDFSLLTFQTVAPFAPVATLYENLGVSFGVAGIPRLPNKDVAFILPYEFSLSFVVGEEDLFDESVFYAEAEGEVGVGIYVHGVSFMAGVLSNSIAGFGDEETDEFDGTNVGTFFGVRFARDGIPVVAAVRVISGDVDGVELSLGGAF